MLKILKDIFFPQDLNCIVCDKDIDLDETRYSICKECIKKIKFIEGKTCLKCGRKLSNFYCENICPQCEKNFLYFDRGISCTQYDEITKKIIINFKYYNNRYIGRSIAKIMGDYLKSTYIDDIDLIVSVPISLKKYRLKGYNHSDIIGKYLGVFCKKKYLKNYLIRKKDTRPLKELTKLEREKEIRGAIGINRKYEKIYTRETILLVDDIYTTGTTLNECSRILREIGYNRIIVITFSIGTI